MTAINNLTDQTETVSSDPLMQILKTLEGLNANIETLIERIDGLEESIHDLDRDYGSGFDIRRYET